MRGIIERVGPCRMTYREPDFSTVVRAIIYQQVSGRVAAVIHERVERGLGGRVTPRSVLKRDLSELRAMGLSGQKASYLLDLAEKTQIGELRFRELPDLEDAEVIERMTRVKGIGEWTAQMFLMFALRRRDVLPVGDLGVRMAMKKWYGLDDLPKRQEMEQIAQPWRPWASVAVWYLWRSLDGEAEI